MSVGEDVDAAATFVLTLIARVLGVSHAELLDRPRARAMDIAPEHVEPLLAVLVPIMPTLPEPVRFTAAEVVRTLRSRRANPRPLKAVSA